MARKYILAFEKTIKSKDAIELNIRNSSDGEVVAFYDRSLRHMAGINKLVIIKKRMAVHPFNKHTLS